MRHVTLFVLAPFCLAMVASTAARSAESKVSGPDDPDFKIQGEYVGMIKPPGAEDGIKVGAQVIALGGGKFHSVGYGGGPPGEG